MKTSSRSILIPLLLATHCFVISPRAATVIWSGGGSDDLWSTPDNWAGVVPMPGDFLIFTNTVRLNNTNNVSPGTLFGGITFETPAGGFNLWGNQITLGGAIADRQEVTLQTINLPVALGVNGSGTHIVDVVTNGSLTLAGVVSGPALGITK